MAGGALFLLGRDNPDVWREIARDLLQQLDAGRPDAVVIGDENAGFGEFDAPVSDGVR